VNFQIDRLDHLMINVCDSLQQIYSDPTLVERRLNSAAARIERLYAGLNVANGGKQ